MTGPLENITALQEALDELRSAAASRRFSWSQAVNGYLRDLYGLAAQ